MKNFKNPPWQTSGKKGKNIRVFQHAVTGAHYFIEFLPNGDRRVVAPAYPVKYEKYERARDFFSRKGGGERVKRFLVDHRMLNGNNKRNKKNAGVKFPQKLRDQVLENWENLKPVELQTRARQ
ncbi:MAG: hypothetical protein V1676_04945 [Candidatus Diapherotrites archaeon]